MAALLAAPTAAQQKGTLLVRAPMPAAMAALPEGGLVYGELRTGRIFEVSAGGTRSAQPIARVRVNGRGLRGLLGLAVAPDRRVYAAYTSRRNRLIVAKVAPGPRRVVWDGGRAATEANGLRLAFTPSGALLVTVGDRLRSIREKNGRLALPRFGHYAGRVLRLDPAGPRDQRPATLSRGWFNPYALAVTPSGAVWVADNALVGPEALTRGDRGRPRRSTITRLRHVAPAGLAALDDSRLALCGFTSGTLRLYRIGADGRARPAQTLVSGCELGVVRLADGRLAYAALKGIRVIAPPPA